MALFEQATGPPYFSTARAKARAKSKNNAYYCEICNTAHNLKTAEDRRKVLLSDSLMFNSWKQTNKLPCHMDAEIRNGSRIYQLSDWLEKNYMAADKDTPMDVVLVAGINDILAHRKAPTIVEDIVQLKHKIAKHHPGTTLSVATIPCPPKACSLQVTPSQTGSFYDLPPPKNKIDEIEAVNCSITALNRNWGVKFLDLAPIGIQGTGIGRHRQTSHIDERFGAPRYFIEDGHYRGKLHFVYDIRFRLLQQAADLLSDLSF